MNRLPKFIVASLLLAGLLALTSAHAQQPVAQTRAHPFESGEELFYEAEFSRALLRKLDVADFKFRATRTPLSPKPSDKEEPYSFLFTAEVSSKGFFTRLFNLNFRERVESTVEPISFTVERTTIHDEQGKRVRTTEATFDRANGKMSWTQRDPNNPSREPRNVITEFSGQLQDVLSAIYFIRTQPLEVGKSFEMFIGDGGRVYKVPVNVVERKRMKTIFGRVSVVRVDPKLFGPGSLIDDEKGEMSIWLTDDNRRVPVGGRIKTDYGTFDIKLKRVVYNPPA